ncbi:MAG: rhodanese-like domain-containing protein, partial [Candidatus Hydrothermarchaeales archaeon]
MNEVTRTITAFELKEMMDNEGDFILVDFRSSIVYERERIPSAVHMHLGQLEENLSEFDRSKTIVVYCSSENCMSSQKAAVILSKAGFDVLEFEAGIDGWKQAGFPIENAGL